MIACEQSVELGAYVLGALDADERRRVEEHVRACPACAAELAEFEGLPAVLARVPPEDLRLGPVQPSPELFDRVRAAAADHHRRRRRLLAVAAAAIVVIGVGVGVLLGLVRDDGRTYTASQGPVQLTVTATAQESGTALDVTVRGLEPREKCQLWVVDAAGEWYETGDWSATYSGDASFRGWTEVEQPALTDVVLRDAAGEELVRLRL